MKNKPARIPTICPDTLSVGLAAVLPIIALFFGTCIAVAGPVVGPACPKLPYPYFTFLGYLVVPILVARLLSEVPTSFVLFDKNREYVVFSHRRFGRSLIEPTDLAIADILSFGWRKQVKQSKTIEAGAGYKMFDSESTDSLGFSESTPYQPPQESWGPGAPSYYSVAHLSNGQVVSLGRSHSSMAKAIQEAHRLSQTLGVPYSEDVPASTTMGRITPKHVPQWPSFLVLLSLIYCALPLLPWDSFGLS